ncbi:site-specific integrase [Larkinella soli]|uniref:site-specific integrase n=1 Tax=Larkinella soli TaxID=1770527 RepID=UPI000FFB1CA1|nr:site-specific integrase [Larkinella soli]
MTLATVSLFLDRRASGEGTGVIKWSVCYQRKQRLFTTGLKVSLEEWEFLQQYKGGLKGHVKNEERRHLWQKVYGDQYQEPFTGQRHDGYLKRAQVVLAQLGNAFSFEAFAQAITQYGKLKETPEEKTDVLAALWAKSASMSKEGRIGNAVNYELAAKSLRRFVDSFSDQQRWDFLQIPVPRRKTATASAPATLQFAHLTPEFLTAYEQWMLVKGKTPQSPGKPPTGASSTTVGIYLRHLRAVVNEAIQQGHMSREAYPFGRHGYVIPAGANVKKALSRQTLDRIKDYQPLPGTLEQRSHDLWLFSYYCNGANLTDLCQLTWDSVDLASKKLTFVRQKTRRSRKQNQTPIVAYLRPETLAILDRWGTRDRRADQRVFPFVEAWMDPVRQRRVIHQLVKVTNQWMGRIARQLGIEEEVTTYAARHSFATTLLKGHAPLAMISKSLGHTNLKTTESYLGSFDDEEAKAYLNLL